MSFSFEFTATAADAIKIIAEEYAPQSVKVFVADALVNFPGEQLVQVKGTGHLYQTANDYKTSNAVLEIKPIATRKPKTPESV